MISPWIYLSISAAICVVFTGCFFATAVYLDRIQQDVRAIAKKVK